MSIPNYLYALANHKGPANVTVGGMIIPVQIMDIDHESDLRTSETTFKCMVVNKDQIRAVKNVINSVYGCNPKTEAYIDYVRSCLEKSTTSRKRDAVNPMAIDRVKFGKTTAVYWKTGDKTSIICSDGPCYSKETGLAMCLSLRRQGITSVIFNDPATIVIWADGTKTVVKCQKGDVYSKETGLALCIAKKALGNQGNFNDIFHKWIPEEDEAQEAESSEPGCSFCSCATRTDKRFIVHTPSGLEIETVFNNCPCCGRKIPEVPNEMPEM